MPPTTRPLLPVALAPALLLASCITEGGPRDRGVKLRPDGTTAPPAAAPTGTPPLARPAPGGSSTSGRANFALRPLGRVPYDGLTLPLASPDGKYVVTQTGEAPSWPLLLATPAGNKEAMPPVRSRVRLYVAGERSLREAPAATPPFGVMLGRSAGRAGYLVEAPQPDGTRWIGRVGWESGAVQWLVQGPAVNAFAIELADGTIAFSSRGVDERDFALVIYRPPPAGQPGPAARDAEAREATVRTLRIPNASVVFPVTSPDQRSIAAFALYADGTMDLVCVDVEGLEGEIAAPQARHQLGVGANAEWTFQAAAPHLAVPTPAPVTGRGAEPGAALDWWSAVAVLSPQVGRPVMYATGSRNQLVLPMGVVSVAVVFGGANGAMAAEPTVLLTRRNALELLGTSGLTGPSGRAVGTTVWRKPFVVRGQTEDGGVVLAGPAESGEGMELEIVVVQLMGGSERVR